MSPKIPSLTSRHIISILKKKGFILERQSGSHAIFIHPTEEEPPFPYMEKETLEKDYCVK